MMWSYEPSPKYLSLKAKSRCWHKAIRKFVILCSSVLVLATCSQGLHVSVLWRFHSNLAGASFLQDVSYLVHSGVFQWFVHASPAFNVLVPSHLLQPLDLQVVL